MNDRRPLEGERDGEQIGEAMGDMPDSEMAE